MKKLTTALAIVVFALFVIVLGTQHSAASSSEEKSQVYTKQELISLIAEVQETKDNCHAMATNARTLGWTDEDQIIKDIKAKWHKADANQKYYQQLLDKILIAEEEERIAAQKAAEEQKWAKKTEEYPNATYIWRYMKSLGWSDYVCAGIMGNIMAEVGGQSLNINYKLSSKYYYGMCQWSRGYSQVWGADLASQCKFLENSIKYEFDTYGFVYKKGFKFSSFLNMTDVQQAALAFAKCYERCASGSYKVRQNNALKAYKYFVG